jgi:2-hydroxy-3-oxopropionate reductase
LNIIVETAKELNVPLPTTSVVHSLFNAMLAAGWGDLDHSAVIKVIESLAQVEARTDKE